METTNSLLSLRNIKKSYGSVEVLHGVDFDINKGDVVALLGENGAGKSTFSNIIAGAVQASEGEMYWQAKPYKPLSPRHAMSHGLGLIHQELRLLPHLSIAENIFVARYPTNYGVLDRQQMFKDAEYQLKRLGLNVSPNRKVDGLSTAAQQLVEIAKALALNAKLLILDEPTAALGSEETELLFEQIHRLKEEDVAIIYISHRLEEIRQIANRIVVMRDGSKVKEFDRGDVAVKSIVESMVGRNLERMFPEISKTNDEVIIEVKNLSSKKDEFYDINFSVKKGEVLGIAGLIGSGRTALARAITGADSILNGSVILEGKNVTPNKPADSIKNGIVLVPEDRKLQGLVLEHSISKNFSYANFDIIAMFGLIRSKILKDFTNINIEKFNVKCSSNQTASQLSGGNQQKVVLAKWLSRNPKVIVLDEPTRGIDVGARSSVYELIKSLAERGLAVIVVSSDLEEVLGISHRIMVMSQGRQTGILSRENANDVSIMELATR